MSRPEGRGAPRSARITRITGGEHLIRLPYQDVLVMADGFDHAGERALSGAGRAGSAAVSPHLLASAPFAPGTALAAEAALGSLAAGLAGWSATIAAHARAVRGAVALLERADGLVHARLLVEERMVAFAYGRESTAPRVRATDLHVPMSGAGPTGLGSLVDHAGQMSDLSGPEHPENKGTIEVQTLTGDGGRRHIVYLPGMDDLNPFSIDHDVRDAGAAVNLEAGNPTAYGAGVLEALHEAGVEPGEPVLLVGHSQGGMQALALAMHDSPYDVTQVVTLGAPMVPGDLPPDVGVLSLEHAGDPVTLADAGAEPLAPHHVTVTFDSGASPAVAANHGFAHYAAGAVAVEHSLDPSVQQAVDGLAPFLAQPGDQVRSTVFQITRGDDDP